MHHKRICEKFICPKCNQEIKSSRQKHLSYCTGQGPRRLVVHTYGCKRGSKEFSKRISEGIKNRYLNDSDYKNRILRSRIKNGTLNNSWDKVSHENKKLQSERARFNIQRRYENGWDPKAGRAPKYKYRDFTVDGSWELTFCEWADKSNISFSRNKQRFDYIDEAGIHRKYKPDFLIDDVYVEVKGYETERDRCKWKSFQHNLIVLKRPEIKMIRKGLFTIKDLFEHKWGDAVIGSGEDC